MINVRVKASSLLYADIESSIGTTVPFLVCPSKEMVFPIIPDKSVDSDSEIWLNEFVLQVKGFAPVLEFYRMAGEYDYLLKVLVADMRSYDRFYKMLVNNVSGLTDVNSSFAMEQLKYTSELPLT